MIKNESLGIWYLFNPPTVILSLTLINYKNICHSGRFPPFNPWVPDVTGMIKTNGFMFQVSNFYGHLAILTHLNLGVKFLMKIKIGANMCAMLWLSKLTFCQTNAQKPDDFHKQIRGITPFFTETSLWFLEAANASLVIVISLTDWLNKTDNEFLLLFSDLLNIRIEIDAFILIQYGFQLQQVDVYAQSCTTSYQYSHLKGISALLLLNLLLRPWEVRKTECIIFLVQPSCVRDGSQWLQPGGRWILFSVFIAQMFWSDCHSLVRMWAHVSERCHWCNRMSTPSPLLSSPPPSQHSWPLQPTKVKTLSRCWLFILGKKSGMIWVIGWTVEGGREENQMTSVMLLWCQDDVKLPHISNNQIMTRARLLKGSCILLKRL